MTSSVQPAAQQGAAAPPAPYEKRWLMLPVLLAAIFMVQFDLFVVNVAAPSLEKDLHTSQAALEMIVAGYGFTYAAGLVTGGRLGDIFNPRVMFVGGVIAFTLASLLCGLAQNSGELVTARLLQGLTGAAMVPQVLALITRVFPGNERAKAMGWFGLSMGIGGVAGQVLGGALLDANLFHWGWRVIFLVNVPIGVVTTIVAARVLPVPQAGPRPKLDPVGAIGVTGSLALALLPLVLGRTEGWPAWVWVMLAASVPAMFLSLRYEAGLAKRGGQPLLDLTLFKNKVFARGLVVNVGVFSAFYSFMFCSTLLLQSGLGLSPLRAGFTFAPLAIAFSAASLTAPKRVATMGARLVTLGIVIAAVGMVSLIVVMQASGNNLSAARLIGPLVVIGIGNGIAAPVLAGVVLAGARAANAGAAAGVLTTTQQFSSAAGVAAIGAIFFEALGNKHDIVGFSHSLEWVLGVGLVLIVIAGVTSILLPSPPRPGKQPAAAPPAAAPAK